MDPLTMALLVSAGSGIVSSLMGSTAGSTAANANAVINQMNFQAAERERLQAMFVAERNRSEQQLGTTDAFGNKTQFVAGEGVVTTPSEGTQRLIDLSQFEAEQQLGPDAARARGVREDATDRARKSGLTADALLQQFLRQRPGERDKIRQTLDATTTKGFNQGFDEVQDRALTQQVRAGTSADTLATAIDKAGKQRGGALARLLAGNVGIANQQFEQSKTSPDLANLFNLFATRATGAPSAVPIPSNAGAQANSLNALFANRLGQGDAGTLNAAGRVGGRADFIAPDLSAAQGVGGIGLNLSAILAGLGGMGGAGTSASRGLTNPNAGASFFGG